ncbi:MAG: MFS transporter [Pseudomonadota bacterium]
MAQPYTPPCQDSQINAQPCPEEAGRLPTPSVQTRGLAACILASSMAFIDGSALTVALPALKSEFAGNVMAVQWVLNGYVLALASLTMVGGSLVDTLGRARMLTIGCIAFALASMACALAPGAISLIVARIAQGAAAALVTPASLALIGELFAKSQRSRAIGIWASASALTTAGGPLLGGWLVEASGWRAVFWINLPIAAIAIALLASLPASGVRTQRPFDVLGSILLALALFVFAMAMSAVAPMEGGGTEHGARLSGPVIAALFVCALVLLIGFWAWQKRAAHPLLPAYVFQKRSFAGLNLATLAVYAGLSIMFFLLPFELIERRGLTPVQSGLVFLPFTLSVGFLSRSFGGLADRIGLRPMLIGGSLLSAIGFGLFAVFYSAPIWMSFLLPMSISGLGFAVIVAPLTAGVMASVDEADEGLASGINNTASRIAQMVGVALAALFAASAAGYVIGMGLAAAICAFGALIIVATFDPPARLQEV